MPNAPPPKPRRRLWLKLLIAATVVVVGVVGIVCLAFAIWRGKEHQQLTRRLDAIRALGQPIDPAGVVEPDVPEDQNIVPLILAAASQLVEDKERSTRETELTSADDTAFTPPLNDEELTIVRANVAANAQALATIAPADTRAGAAWHESASTAWPAGVDRTLAQARGVANALNDAARLASDEKRSDVVIDAVLDIDAIADAMCHKPTMIGYLVSVGIHMVATDAAILHAPDLRIGTEPGRAPRAKVERLIAAYVNDAAPRDAMRDALVKSRVAVHADLASGVTSTMPGVPSLSGPLARPLVDRNEVAILDYFAESLRVCDAASRAESIRQSGELKRIESEAQTSNTLMLAAMYIQGMSRISETRYRVTTDRHFAAIALAMRLYQLDHDGRRPTTLDALVPTYLPAVPTDAIDGKPIRYDATRAIIWGAGDNATDENGDATPTNRRWPHLRWTMTDAVVFLNRQPRPATQPAPAP